MTERLSGPVADDGTGASAGGSRFVAEGNTGRTSHRELVAAVEHFTVAAVALTERALVATAGLADLSLPQWRMLSLLHRAPHPPRLAEVASAAGLSAPSASRMVSRLAGRGLIVSTIDLQDRRAIRIRLTQAGKEIVRAVVEARRAEIEERLATVDPPRGFAAALDRTAVELDGSW